MNLLGKGNSRTRAALHKYFYAFKRYNGTLGYFTDFIYHLFSLNRRKLKYLKEFGEDIYDYLIEEKRYWIKESPTPKVFCLYELYQLDITISSKESLDYFIRFLEKVEIFNKENDSVNKLESAYTDLEFANIDIKDSFE